MIFFFFFLHFSFYFHYQKYEQDLGVFSRNRCGFLRRFPSTMLAEELFCRVLKLAFETSSVPAPLPPLSPRRNTTTTLYHFHHRPRQQQHHHHHHRHHRHQYCKCFFFMFYSDVYLISILHFVIFLYLLKTFKQMFFSSTYICRRFLLLLIFLTTRTNANQMCLN